MVLSVTGVYYVVQVDYVHSGEQYKCAVHGTAGATSMVMYSEVYGEDWRKTKFLSSLSPSPSLSLCVSVSLSLSLSLCLFVSVSLYQSLSLSVYLSVCLSSLIVSAMNAIKEQGLKYFLSLPLSLFVMVD